MTVERMYEVLFPALTEQQRRDMRSYLSKLPMYARNHIAELFHIQAQALDNERRSSIAPTMDRD